MANQILWDASPAGSLTTLIAADGALKNLANAGTAVSAEYTNGTSLNRWAKFLLYLHDFAAAPTAGGYFELHIVYQMDGSVYADGDDGTLGTPRLSNLTLVDTLPVSAVDEAQYLQSADIPLAPLDFKVCCVNKCGQAIANTDGSLLKMGVFNEELQ